MKLTPDQLKEMGYVELANGEFAKTKRTVTAECEPGSQPLNVPLRSKHSAVVSKSTEDRLNKTERRWLAVLRSRNYAFIGIHSVTLRMGTLKYTPDFMTVDASGVTLFDSKGAYIWEDATVKIKAFAAFFTFWKFVVAQWKDGQWTEKLIKP